MSKSEYRAETEMNRDTMEPAQHHGKEHSVVVLYDGQCPLCSREIAHYRRRRGADGIQWVDVTRSDIDPVLLGVSREAALRRFHVRDPGGCWRTGASAFVLLWSSLPAYRWLAKLVSGLGLLPAMEWAYVRFLHWRSRDRCDADRCRKGS